MPPESSERGTGSGSRRGQGPALSRMGHRQRSMVWTGIFAFITILGTWYGAQLKTDWDAVKAKKKVLEATPEERIEMLQRQRARLVMAKEPLEDKLERLKTRTREKEMENASPEERKRMVEEQARQDLESGKSKEEKPKAREFKWFGH